MSADFRAWWRDLNTELERLGQCEANRGEATERYGCFHLPRAAAFIICRDRAGRIAA